MMRHAIVRYGYRASIAILLLAIGALSGFLVVVAAPNLAKVADTASPSPAPSVALSPAPSGSSAMALSPIGIEMPAGSDCSACHLTATGAVGTKPIPAMAHPLWGWQDCTACHATGSLVQSAPGHSGLHKNDCLVCHRVPSASASSSPAPLRPEHMGGTQPCTACHGVDQHAPMPDNMKGRGDNCWICHNGPEFNYLFQSQKPSTAQSPSPSGAASPGPSAANGLPLASPASGTSAP